MITSVKLIAATVSRDSPHERIPEKQWLQRAMTFPVSRPGRLAFFVFEIICPYGLHDKFFFGLESFESEHGMIVAGTAEQFLIQIDKLPSDAPHEIHVFYRYVKQKLRDFGL